MKSSSDEEAPPRKKQATEAAVVGAGTQSSSADLFSKYADSNGAAITDDGIARLCTDLKVDPMAIEPIVLSWKLAAAKMCVFTKEEWAKGMQALGNPRDVAALAARLAVAKGEIKDTSGQAFRSFYDYTYGFGRDEGQKNVALETAVALWGIVLAGRFPHLEEWCEFVTSKGLRVVTKDLWSQLLEFVKVANGPRGLQDFDPDGAWPVLIDEFVASKNKK